ncbi:MAG: GNAT family N-acetyltransferase [Sandaracinaceae bacterium]
MTADAPELAPVEGRAEIVFRPMLKGDTPFFAHSWLKSFQRSDAVRGVSSETYFYFHHRLLERLLQRSRVVMACEKRDPDRLHGFACFEDLSGTCLLHYVYVRGSRRRLGIGAALIDEALRACKPLPGALVWTHRTKGSDRWLGKYARERRLAALYNPYLMHEATR